MKAPIVFISQLPTAAQQRWLKQLAKSLPDECIKLASEFNAAEKQRCEIAIVANPDMKLLAQYNQLKWVQSLWAGVEGIVSELDRASFSLSRLIDPSLAQTMSEAVLTWLLYLHRDMPKYLAQQARGVWQQHDYRLPNECTVGILGLGELGRVSALRLQQNGFKVLGWSQSHKELAEISCYYGQQGLQQLLPQCDIVVCLLPLTSQTKQLINCDFFQLLPRGASLINFARGAIVSSEALLENIANGHIAHAVLDVFEQEPLEQNSAFWAHENITVLPHISAPTHLISASKIVAKNIATYRKTGALPRCVDLNKGY